MMGIFSRKSEVIVASGEKLDLDDKKEIERHKKRSEKWQDTAWRFYDEIPEIWFAHNYMANLMRRVRLYPAIILDPYEPPVRLTTEDFGPLALRANAELDRLRGPDGTHGSLMHDLSLQLDIPGEGYLVIAPNEETGLEEASIYSHDELKTNASGEWILSAGPDDKMGEPLHPDAYVARLWRSHPRWRKKADSSMRGVLELCDELQILSRYIRATGRSRINNGIFFVPSEAQLRQADAASSASDGGAQTVDPLLDQIMRPLVEPITDEGSPFSVAPGMIKIKAELIEKFRHMSFTREFDQTAAEQRAELIGRIATGLDMPAEVVTGKASLNHWSMWQVDEDTFKAHAEPRCITAVSSLTEAFMNVALADMELGGQVVIWFDAIDAISHPNRTKDADSAHDRDVISDTAYRRYKGYKEEDAPTPEEVQQRNERRRIQRPAAEPRGADGTNPAEDAERGAPEEASVTAAALPVPLTDLGERLKNIDYELRLRLQVASQGVVFRALEKAGAKLRRKVGRNEALVRQIDNLPNHLVAAQLGKELVSSWFQIEDELLEDALTPLFPQYQRWTKRAQDNVRELAAQFGSFDQQAVVAEQETARSAGWAVLTVGLTAFAASRLFNPDVPTPIAGEFDSSMMVPPGIIRESVSTAGGASGMKSSGGAIVDPNTGAPQGGVATGRTALETFRSVGVRANGWVWSYGDPGSRETPFESHEDLDGLEFTSWSDPSLVVHSEDSWIGESYYFPGDHNQCQCDFIPLMVRTEEESEEEVDG